MGFKKKAEQRAQSGMGKYTAPKVRALDKEKKRRVKKRGWEEGHAL
jgi:hypothetical protein